MKVLWIVVFLSFAINVTAMSGQKLTENEVLIYGTIQHEATMYEGGVIATPRTPAKNAIVKALDEEGNVFSAESDENGNYELKLPTGIYEIHSFIDTKSSIEISSEKKKIVIKEGKTKLDFILISHSCG